MTTTTNIQMNSAMNDNRGTRKGKGKSMKLSVLVAPQFSKRTMTVFVFAYLAMVTMILIMAARPFDSAEALDFGVGPQTVSASTLMVVVEIPEVRVPSAWPTKSKQSPTHRTSSLGH